MGVRALGIILVYLCCPVLWGGALCAPFVILFSFNLILSRNLLVASFCLSKAFVVTDKGKKKEKRVIKAADLVVDHKEENV